MQHTRSLLVTYFMYIKEGLLYVHAMLSLTVTPWTPWTIALKSPLSMRFLRQTYWSGWPFLIPGDIPNSEIKPTFLASPELVGRFFITAPPGKIVGRV